MKHAEIAEYFSRVLDHVEQNLIPCNAGVGTEWQILVRIGINVHSQNVLDSYNDAEEFNDAVSMLMLSLATGAR